MSPYEKPSSNSVARITRSYLRPYHCPVKNRPKKNFRKKSLCKPPHSLYLNKTEIRLKCSNFDIKKLTHCWTKKPYTIYPDQKTFFFSLLEKRTHTHTSSLILCLTHTEIKQDELSHRHVTLTNHSLSLVWWGGGSESSLFWVGGTQFVNSRKKYIIERKKEVL